MDRAAKGKMVEELGQVFSEAGVVVVTHYQGLTVAEMNDLRGRMADAGAHFKVAKNRLAKIALERAEKTSIADLFTGPTAIAYSEDPIAAPKAAMDYAKGNDKLVILGGVMGEERLDEGRVKALAALPSLDELRAKLVGMISTPATRVAGVLQAPAGQLARVMGAYADKGGEAA